MKEYSLEKAGNDKKKPPTTDKKNLLSLSLTSLKSSNLLWLKTSKISIQPLNCSNPLMEIIVFKNGSFKLLKHKRILQIYHEKIICYKVFKKI